MEKNISELIKTAKKYNDYIKYYADDYKSILGGEYNMYGYTYFGDKSRVEIGLLAEGISDVDAAIELGWKNTGLEKENEQWTMLDNYAIIYITDKAGNIVKETPRRYY